MDIVVYSRFNEELKHIWEKCEKNAVMMTPFHSYAWLSHWYQTIGGPILSVEPQIVSLKNNENTIAILPLCIRNSFGIQILEWLGGANTDYMGPLVEPKYSNHLINQNYWDLIKSKINNYDIIHFQKQTKWSMELMGKIGCSDNMISHKAILKPTWDEYYLTVKKRIRSDSKRQRNRLNKIGYVRFVIAESANEKKNIIKRMIAQKSRQYKETGVKDMFAINKYQDFYIELADINSLIINIHCAALKVGNITIATHIGLVHENTFYYLMPAYEGGDWRKYSPGRLLLLELLQWSIEEGLQSFDFTSGEEAYKKDWCDSENKIYSFIKANTFKGIAYYKFLMIKNNLKKSQVVLYGVKSLRFFLNKFK